jgi:hypothetical protein
MKTIATAAVLAFIAIGGVASAQQSATDMSFFVSSRGSGEGANLGGLAGADALCQSLAEAAGSTRQNWRAYLSTSASGGQPAVNARDRIGDGPWVNARGVTIAEDVDALHSNTANVNKETALTESGEVVTGSGDTPNRHDILTGSQLDGTAFTDGQDHTCSNWTSDGEGSAHVGHHDRLARGQPGSPWNSAHASQGCSQDALRGTGGDGLLYCFAAD